MASKLLKSAALVSVLTCTAMAADQAQLGVGIGLSNDSTTLRLPINLDNEIRIEPEFGLSYVNDDNFDRTGLLIGSGVYMMQQPSKSINLYYGGKALIDYNKYDPDNAKSDSSTQFLLGGVFGFEYMLDRQVSVGGEAAAYLGLGDATSLQTQGQALLRYYF